MNLKSSLILKVKSKNSLNEFIAWLNQNSDKKYSENNIINQASISLINLTGESIKIKTVREIKEQLAYSNYHNNQTRYFVFFNAHLATIPAQNALLKSLEEPPYNTQIILVTNQPGKLLETIRSRCHQINFVNHSIDGSLESKYQNKTNTAEIEKIYFEIVASNFGEKINIAAKYKERSEALELCTQLVMFLHKKLNDKNTKIETSKVVFQTNELLKTIKYLEANVNVLLALENCFFELN